LEVEPDARLEALRRRMVDGLRRELGIVARPIEDDRFRFHVTLACGLPAAAFRRERERLRGDPASFHFDARSLVLLARVESRWVNLRRVALTGSAGGRDRDLGRPVR